MFIYIVYVNVRNICTKSTYKSTIIIIKYFMSKINTIEFDSCKLINMSSFSSVVNFRNGSNGFSNSSVFETLVGFPLCKQYEFNFAIRDFLILQKFNEQGYPFGYKILESFLLYFFLNKIKKCKKV